MRFGPLTLLPAEHTPYSLPVGPEGAGWELIIGGDRYCAESSVDARCCFA